MDRAKGDLAIASSELPEGAFWEDFCFHAQQAAEKALKAVHVYHDIIFRYTNDLDELAENLRQHSVDIPSDIKEATILTTFAWEARYPGVGEPVTMDEYKEAVSMATSVVAWADGEIREEQ